MRKYKDCKFYNNPTYTTYFIEYRGDFLNEINQINYACGDVLNKVFAVIAVKPEELGRLLKDVPSIKVVEFEGRFILEEISPSTTSNIDAVTINPYLNLTGNGVIVGLIDTGIDYLNEAFIKEDGTTRILGIWDQTTETINNPRLYIGSYYDKTDINQALESSKTGGDPYSIVPT
ncbi:MAG: S8 family peptidase, partial [Clostridium sp.]